MNISNQGGGLSMTGGDGSQTSDLDERVSHLDYLVDMFVKYTLPHLVRENYGGTDYKISSKMEFLQPITIDQIHVPFGTRSYISLNPDNLNDKNNFCKNYIQFDGHNGEVSFNCQAQFQYTNLRNAEEKMSANDLIRQTLLYNQTIEELKQIVNTFNTRIETNKNDIITNSDGIGSNGQLIADSNLTVSAHTGVWLISTVWTLQ